MDYLLLAPSFVIFIIMRIERALVGFLHVYSSLFGSSRSNFNFAVDHLTMPYIQLICVPVAVLAFIFLFICFDHSERDPSSVFL